MPNLSSISKVITSAMAKVSPKGAFIRRIQNPVISFRTDLSGTQTVMNQLSSPVAFSGLRLKFAKYSAQRTFKCFVAVTSTANNDGSALTWVPVLYAGSSTIVIPQLANNAIPEEVFSDYVSISSVASSTGTHILQIRVVEDNLITPMDWNVLADLSSTSDLVYGASNGLRWGIFAGDRGNTGSIAPTTTAYMRTMVQAVSFYHRSTLSYTLASIGDSLDQGWNSASANGQFQRQSPVLHAVNALISLGYDISDDACAIAAQSTTDMILYQRDIVIQDSPDFCTIRFGTPNDGSTQDSLFKAFSRKVELAKELKKNGITPILLTMYPYMTVGNIANDTFRQAMNDDVRAMSNMFTIADLDLAIRNPADVHYINPTYSIGTDTIHLNALGYQVCGQTIANAIVNRIEKKA